MVKTCKRTTKRKRRKSEINIIWQPQPGSQEIFLSCPIFECLYEGTRGPGKTDALLMDFAQFVNVGFGPAWRGILFQVSYPALEEVIVKSNKWFPKIFPGCVYKGSSHRWVFPSGEQLLFRYADKIDDYWNYHGHEYPWIGWEELCRWSNLDLYLKMMSVCRSSEPGLPRHYRATCNPLGPGHNAVKMRLIDPAPRGIIMEEEVVIEGKKEVRERVSIHGSYKENKYLLDYDPDYLKNIAMQPEHIRKAWLEGDWDIVAGGMFDDVWDPKVHVVQPFEIPKSWRIDRSFDWGSAKPYSVGFWAESDGTDIVLPDGTAKATQRGDLFRIAEIYGWTGKPNEGTRELATGVARRILKYQKELCRVFNPGPADSSIFTIDNGNSIAGDMEKIGVRWNRANMKSGSRINGWELLRQRFENSIKREGPGIYIFDTCRQFIRTVPVLPRDKRQSDDVDTDAEDHCLGGDTLVVTAKGGKPIKELVGTKGLVMTAGGYFTEYKNCRLTRKNAEVFRVTFEDDSFIICTGDHKILTEQNEWKQAREFKSSSYQKNSKNFLASRIIYADITSRKKVSDFIARFGNITKDRLPKASTSIISTETRRIITSKILSLLKVKSTLSSIMSRGISTRTQQPQGNQPANGTAAKKVLTGTKNNIRKTANKPCSKKWKSNAGTVAKNLLGVSARFIAQIIANLHTAEKPGRITSNVNALFAEKPSSLISTIQARPVRRDAVQSLAVKQVESAGLTDVYCLEANITHCFVLSNGIIVHNCADEVRYRVLERRHTMTVRQAS